MKNIFITGVTSYLGKNLLNKLDQYNVYGLINKTHLDPKKNFVPLNLNLDDLNLFFNQKGIDTLIHLASNSSGFYEDNIESLVNVNVQLSNKILQATKNSTVKKVIYSGSYLQNVKQNPLNFYSISKQIFENLLENFTVKNNIQSVSIQFGDIFGKGDSRDKLIPYLLTNEDKSQVKFKSNGLGCFSPIHISDATDLIISEIESPFINKFEKKVGFTKIISVKEFVHLYKKIRNKSFESIFNTEDPVEEMVINFQGTYYVPEISLEKSISEL